MNHVIMIMMLNQVIQKQTLNNNEPCDNEPIDNETSDNEASNNEPCDNETSDNEASDNESNNNEPCDNKEKSADHEAYNKTNNLIDQVNLLAKVRKGLSSNINKIYILMSELQDKIYSDDSWLRLVEMNKTNALLDESLDYVWMIYGKNREKNEINNIDIDKDKDIDIDGYVAKYTDIVNDKSELVNKIGEVLDNIMLEVQNIVKAVKKAIMTAYYMISN